MDTTKSASATITLEPPLTITLAPHRYANDWTNPAVHYHDHQCYEYRSHLAHQSIDRDHQYRRIVHRTGDAKRYANSSGHGDESGGYYQDSNCGCDLSAVTVTATYPGGADRTRCSRVERLGRARTGRIRGTGIKLLGLASVHRHCGRCHRYSHRRI